MNIKQLVGLCRLDINQLLLDDGSVTDVDARRAQFDVPFDAVEEAVGNADQALVVEQMARGMGLVLDIRDWVTEEEAARRRAARGEG